MATPDVTLHEAESTLPPVRAQGRLEAGLWTLIAWLTLVLTDVLLKVAGFPRFHRMLRAFPTVRWVVATPRTQAQVCGAVRRATAYYLKHARCLQRSATVTLLLRLLGTPAEMVIGIQKVPFQAHAWVELDGMVVNDRPIVQKNLVVLERF